jgi:hypothetical protein
LKPDDLTPPLENKTASSTKEAKAKNARFNPRGSATAVDD